MRILLSVAFISASLSAIVVTSTPATADSAIEEVRKTQVPAAEPAQAAVDPAPTASVSSPGVPHRSRHHRRSRRVE